MPYWSQSGASGRNPPVVSPQQRPSCLQAWQTPRGPAVPLKHTKSLFMIRPVISLYSDTEPDHVQVISTDPVHDQPVISLPRHRTWPCTSHLYRPCSWSACHISPQTQNLTMYKSSLQTLFMISLSYLSPDTEPDHVQVISTDPVHDQPVISLPRHRTWPCTSHLYRPCSWSACHISPQTQNLTMYKSSLQTLFMISLSYLSPDTEPDHVQVISTDPVHDQPVISLHRHRTWPCTSHLYRPCSWSACHISTQTHTLFKPYIYIIYILTRIAQSEHNVSPFATVEGVANY